MLDAGEHYHLKIAKIFSILLNVENEYLTLQNVTMSVEQLFIALLRTFAIHSDMSPIDLSSIR